MKNLLLLSFTVALLVGAIVFCASATSVTTDLGDPELKLFQSLITGNFGTFLGLLTAFIGAYTLIVKGETGFGVMLIALGVVITLLPGVYNGMRLVTCPIAEALGGSCTTGSSNSSGSNQ